MSDDNLFDILEAAGREAAKKAQAEAWAAGIPYVIGKNGKVIRVYPDGREMEVVRDGSGNVKEIEFTGK